MSDRLLRGFTRKIEQFHRICDRTETLVCTEGSVTQLNTELVDLGELVEEIVNISNEISDQAQTENGQESAPNDITQVQQRYKAVSEKVKLHLESRQSESRSEASARPRSVARSHVSNASRASVLSKEAEINVRLHHIQLRQLERRLERERQQGELERAARLAEAQDAIELAAAEAGLRRAAENDLSWSRIDDFAEEIGVTERPDPADNRLERPCATLVQDQSPHVLPSVICGSPVTRGPPFTEQRPRAPTGTTQPPSSNAGLDVPLTVERPPPAPPEETTVRHTPPVATEQRRPTTSVTSWIAEAAYSARTARAADPVMSGARRSVPQIQLPKFSGKPIEWPQWAGLFKTLIHDQQDLSDAEKLAHLQSSVTGVAKQAVEGMLVDGSLYLVALQTLMERFGREEDIVKANLATVFDIPPVKELDPSALSKLHAAIHCAVTVLSNLGFDADLNSIENLRQTVMKLPVTLMQAWSMRVVELDLKRPTLKDFDIWLEKQVRGLASVPRQRPEAGKPPRGGGSRHVTSRSQPNPAAFTAAPRSDSAGQPTREEGSTPLCTCGRRHALASCPEFLQKTPAERARAVGESGRCFVCLKPGHRSRHCPSDDRCSEPGCEGRHHRTLHGSGRVFPRNGNNSGNEAHRTVAVATPQENETTLLQIVPIRVHGDRNYIDTFALLDSGAQVSLCTEELARRLKLSGETRPLSLNNVEGTGPRRASLKTSLQLTALARDSDPATVTASEVWTVPKLNIHSSEISGSTRAQWHHLEGLDLSFARPGEVQVLLGANVLEGILQREVRVGRPGQPVAVKSHFGWALCGKISGLLSTAQQQVMHVHRTPDRDAELHELVQSWWSTEAFGTAYSETKPMSHEDRRAVKMLQSSTRLADGHFESPLLWKTDDVTMPENRLGALRRLERTEQALRKNPAKAASYNDTISSYISDGHARKLSDAEVAEKNSKRWLLPHHAVSNPNKPGKIRVVFDAAAEFKGVSLNQQLLTGPDLLQELPGILVRFREKPVAIAGDIEQMFLQVRIQSEDRPALSFLWRNMESNRPPDTYEMTKAIFGAKCSPAIASYALRQTMEGCAHTEQWDSNELAKQFYMDDYVASEESPESASHLLHTVTALAASGGFRLRKWTSNSRTVLSSVHPTERAHPDWDPALPLPSERVLGLMWDTETDTVSVQPPPTSQQAPVTKRKVLSAIASTFDPLGLVAPFTLLAKLLMQDLWKQQLSWDTVLTEDDQTRWRVWQESTARLAELQIPRCYRPDTDAEITRRELHVFSDASEAAFGAAVYLRQVTIDGTVSCTLVASRTRIAPLKKLTIVRLELQGAVLATRLAQSIESALSTPADKFYFWTDSEVVLGYIGNDSRRFQTFVANRIAEIRESTAPSQWRHVPSAMNPADDCSRGLGTAELTIDSRWFCGPQFLHEPEEDWPAPRRAPAPDDHDPEVKTVAVVTAPAVPALQPDPANFSSWTRYRRVMAWVIRFARNFAAAHSVRCSEWSQSGPLTADELSAAETHILRQAQRENFPEELAALERGRPLAQTSPLLQLTPAIDANGLLRVGGRLDRSQLPADSKHPIILPRHCDVTRLIVIAQHRQVLHAGTEHTLNELRRRYWVPKARSTIKALLHPCAVCKRRRAQPQAPLMADLPDARFDSRHAFSSVGLDFCGPVNVRVRRHTEKRYILLVTCLATRAVHLELTPSLDTDSFLLALRRFMARRGQPSRIFSDNWRSFKKAERELRESLKKWNTHQICDAMTQNNIEWRYSPPGGPHMGGCWERLVASVKRAVRVVIGSQCVTDEVLATVLAEVEFVLNSRPLTYVSSDGSDPIALTPNHLLLGRDDPCLPPSVTTDERIGIRRRWKHAQQIAEHFWRRWTREYVPTLIKREKWTRDTQPLAVGDVVLVAEDNLPRGRWPLARVSKLLPGRDGRVRSAELKTRSGSYVRPVVKMCRLEEAD